MSRGSLSRRAFLRQSALLAATAAAAPGALLALDPKEAWARTRDVVGFPAGTTYERSIRPLDGAGYRRLVDVPGWPLVVREDLGAAGRRNREQRRVTLASILHLTDVQVPDAQSPARVEWLSRYGELFRAAWRPHEAVVNHISEAAVRQARSVGRGPVTGRRYDFAVSTGDNIDNMQANELRWFLTLMNGSRLNGPLVPNSGGAEYEGVQRYWRHPQLPAELTGGYDPYYYRPDPPPTGFAPDLWKDEHGYPDLPGFLDAATEPFDAGGLGIPWYSMYGNHDGLVQGNAPRTPFFDGLVTGIGLPEFLGGMSPKFVGFPNGFPWSETGALMFFGALLAQAITPEVLFTAPFLPITSDIGRRFVGPHEYVRAHWAWTRGEPVGHGYTEDNLGDGPTETARDLATTLYYAFRPVPGAPILGISLDTTNRRGGSEGSIGRRQLAWLEQQLRSVSRRWYDAGGRLQRQRAEDHVILIFGHHGLGSLSNADPSPDDPERVLGDELRAVLHRYPNVVAFVNGHSHINRVWARRDASRRTDGFWEISTCAQLDYPMQTRAIELVDNRDGTLSIFCSLIDQGGPADPFAHFGAPGGAYDLLELAGYGRELAYNDFRDHEQNGDPFDYRVGMPFDRNVELLLTAPFGVIGSGPPQRLRDQLPAPALSGRP
jgi:metallophosphoesterase (TIGR03767 family)